MAAFLPCEEHSHWQSISGQGRGDSWVTPASGVWEGSRVFNDSVARCKTMQPGQPAGPENE